MTNGAVSTMGYTLEQQQQNQQRQLQLQVQQQHQRQRRQQQQGNGKLPRLKGALEQENNGVPAAATRATFHLPNAVILGPGDQERDDNGDGGEGQTAYPCQ